MPSRPRRPDPPPLRVDVARTVLVGTLLWLLALGVLAVASLAGARVPGWWLWMCGCGAALGCLGVPYCRRRQAAGE